MHVPCHFDAAQTVASPRLGKPVGCSRPHPERTDQTQRICHIQGLTSIAMDVAWSQSLAMLYQPTESAVQWPAEQCRHISRWPYERPPTKPPKVVVARHGATDDSVLQALRTQGMATRDLADLLKTSRRAMVGQLLRLHEAGLVVTDSEGVWRVLP